MFLRTFVVAMASYLQIENISKSYGVPGLRLGIMASADTNLIQQTKRDIAIWNINSFGEYFLQICGKYEKDYRKSCQALAAERRRFAAALADLPFLTVWPSAANFLLLEVKDPFAPQGLAAALGVTAKIIAESVEGDVLVIAADNDDGLAFHRSQSRRRARGA